MVTPVDVDLDEAAEDLDEHFEDYSFKVSLARFMEVYETVAEDSIEVSPPLESDKEDAEGFLNREYEPDVSLERVNRGPDLERYIVR